MGAANPEAPGIIRAHDLAVLTVLEVSQGHALHGLGLTNALRGALAWFLINMIGRYLLVKDKEGGTQQGVV